MIVNIYHATTLFTVVLYNFRLCSTRTIQSQLYNVSFPLYAAPKLAKMTVTVMFISLVALTAISVSNILADHIDLEFDVGQCIEASYTAPTTGRSTVNICIYILFLRLPLSSCVVRKLVQVTPACIIYQPILQSRPLHNMVRNTSVLIIATAMHFTLNAIHFQCSSTQSNPMKMRHSVIIVWIVALIGISESTEYREYIDLRSFDVGKCIEAVYTAPTTGTTTLQLRAADSTVVLTVNYRKYWGGNPSTGKPWQNILILNSKIGGRWGTEQHVEDVETTPGTILVWKICARDADFSVNLNGKELATYAYRTPVNTVSTVMLSDRDYDSVLKQLCVAYPEPSQ